MFCPSEFALLNLRDPGVHVLTRYVSSFYRRCDRHHHQPPVACSSADVYIASWISECLSWSMGWVLCLVASDFYVKFKIVDGLSKIVRQEGPLGLFRGTSLALVGVSSGSIQFMVYEKMKSWGFERKRRQYARAGKAYGTEADKLVRCTFGPFLKQNSEYWKSDPVKFCLYRHVPLQQIYFPISNLPLPSG